MCFGVFQSAAPLSPHQEHPLSDSGAWDDATEEWYFPVVDVVAILTDSQDPGNYWKVLKNRLKKEGNQSVTNCNQLKLPSADGKFYKTDVATAEQLFRLIQSIPSPEAAPFKVWIAQVAAEGLKQMPDPERSIKKVWAAKSTKEYKQFKGLKNIAQLELLEFNVCQLP